MSYVKLEPTMVGSSTYGKGTIISSAFPQKMQCERIIHAECVKIMLPLFNHADCMSIRECVIIKNLLLTFYNHVCNMNYVINMTV